MSKEIARGIIDDVSEWLMRPESYEGLREKFIFACINVENEKEMMIINAECDEIFILNTIINLINILSERTPELVTVLFNYIEANKRAMWREKNE